MILEGMYFQNEIMHSETRVYPQFPTITSGLVEGTDAVYRYGLRESSYPTLVIVDELEDAKGNYIPAGHYELALSDDRQFLLLLEAKELRAIIPVFKLEVTMDEKPQVHDRKSLKEKKTKKSGKQTVNVSVKVCPLLIRKNKYIRKLLLNTIKTENIF